MNDLENIPNHHYEPIKTILRVIDFSQSQFSLIFLHCNDAELREQVAAQLRERSPNKIEEITLPHSAISLYDNISLTLDRHPEVLMVFGLETVNNLDSILQFSNQIREEFRKNFTFPLLIWIDDQILRKILRVAPDLETWGSIIGTPNYYNGENQVKSLAQIHRFLAEAALENQQWSEAKKQAQYAQEILTSVDHIILPDDGLYHLLIARSQIGLGETSTAIKNLEIAKTHSAPPQDPQLYIEILKTLASLYFDHGNYLEAFYVRQEQLQVEQQYGLRAFLGSSYLNPQRPIMNGTNGSNGRSMAFGREEDIKSLWQRISDNEHPLVVIHGQFAVGKTSIIQGGLVPILEQELIDDRQLLPIILREYTNWLEELWEQLLNKLENKLQSTIAIETFNGLSPQERIIKLLNISGDKNLLTVLIFDQLEEFFFVANNLEQKRTFYQLLRSCLDIPFVKIILTLREEYLHYLLEIDRLVDLRVTNNNILDKTIRYYLGNFSKAVAKRIIQTLMVKDQFELQMELIDQLVEELGDNLGEVRPLELQIVGAQLEKEGIDTLEQYEQFGGKQKLLEKFLQDVIKSCGPENESTAQLVLYLLTGENGTKPLKTQAEIITQLSVESDKLDLVLKIFVGSGLVWLVRESLRDRYQLVHDCLVQFIRYQYARSYYTQLSAQLERIQAELRQEREAEEQAQLVTKLEEDALIALDQFQTDPLLSLVTAVGNANLLKSIVQNNPLDKYPTVRPIYTLNTILDTISDRNIIKGHEGGITSVCFSPDGQSIGTGSWDKTIRLWNLRGENIQQFRGHEGGITSVCFSPDGQSIGTGSEDGTARLWNLQGKNIQQFRGHEGGVTSICFSPDGQSIGTGSEDGTARLWNLQGKNIQQFRGHEGGVTSICFSPDGQSIGTGSEDGTARLWNLQGENIQQFHGHEDWVTSVSFSPDGQILATTSVDKTVRLWNLQGETIQQFHGHENWVTSVSFSPDGKTIATTSVDKTARLWNLQGETIQQFHGHENWVTSVGFSPDGKTIATTSVDKTARLWGLNRHKIQEIRGHEDWVTSVSFSPDGQNIATGSRDNTARLWNWEGRLIQEFKGHQSRVTSVNFSPDGQTIGTGSADKTARLWNLQGDILGEFQGHEDWVTSVSFSPNGQILATGSRDKIARLWSLQGDLLGEFPGHEDWVTSVSFSPNGQALATGSADKIARLWNLQGDLLGKFPGHEGGVTSVSFSPDGQTVVTGSVDKIARLWNLKGYLIREFKGHDSGITNVSFSPDGQTLATASVDKTVRLWDLKGQLIQEFKGYDDTVTSVSFSPDGQTLATGSLDKIARLWPVRYLDRALKDGNTWLIDTNF
ncbi:WD40 repeat domain-containing protein [Cylindrospermopsis raciborskii]|uniref:WD40 domain-containing protein n=1 Tax=Cylindrospermopsis raciborskii TaxID=77022 RepID=UPI001BADAC0E|nr:WD40 repeat domain-containing protein [Cylindrospermopsis raciborskii]